jgi:endonuclease YncB( thermonuclease family)
MRVLPLYTVRGDVTITERGAAFPRKYPLVIASVIDGDSVRAFLDRGGDDWWLTTVRLHGCAARELRDPGGPEAREYLRGLLTPISPPGIADIFLPRWQGECESLSWDKYAGRILARVWLPGFTHDVSTLLIQAGFAAPWDGRGTQPKPPWPLTTGGFRVDR